MFSVVVCHLRWGGVGARLFAASVAPRVVPRDHLVDRVQPAASYVGQFAATMVRTHVYFWIHVSYVLARVYMLCSKPRLRDHMVIIVDSEVECDMFRQSRFAFLFVRPRSG